VSEQPQLNIVSYRKDSYITVESTQKAECFYIIQQGQVKVTRNVGIKGEGEESLVGGDFFGVVSAMSFNSHIESAQALTDVTLISVSPQQYVALIQRNTQVAVKILMQLSARLRRLDEALTKYTLKKSKAEEEGPSRLFDIAEYYLQQKQHHQAFYVYTSYIKHCPDGENRAAAEKQLEGLAKYAESVGKNLGKGELNRTYGKDHMLFAEGEPGYELFIIQSGSVKITKIIDGKEVLLGVLKAGDIFGEMAILEDKPRTATVIAAEECTVMAVTKTNFGLLIKDKPQIVSKITTLLAGRIWLIFKQLENTFIINPMGRIYGTLLIQLEKNQVDLESTGPYAFGFTWDDLVSMVGLPEKEGYMLLGEMRKDKNIIVNNNRISATSVQGVVKYAEYFRKMDKIEKTKQGNRPKS